MEIPLNKIPESREERKELIGQLIQNQEQLFNQSMGYIQRCLIQKLFELGYTADDLELDKGYEVVISEREKFIASVDILIKLENKVVYAIKCTPASIESWERFMFAFCRVVEPYQIPFAMVTDSLEGRIINILTADVKSSMELPSKKDLLNVISQIDFVPYDKQKLAKEKRILYAFDAIKCCPTSIKL